MCPCVCVCMCTCLHVIPEYLHEESCTDNIYA